MVGSIDLSIDQDCSVQIYKGRSACDRPKHLRQRDTIGKKTTLPIVSYMHHESALGNIYRLNTLWSPLFGIKQRLNYFCHRRAVENTQHPYIYMARVNKSDHFLGSGIATQSLESLLPA